MNIHRAIFERANWWLRDVVSAAYFANVNNNGNANYNNASNANGVRPDFGGIDNKSSKDRQIPMRKERLSFPVRVNDSTEMWNCPMSAWPMGMDTSVSLSGS